MSAAQPERLHVARFLDGSEVPDEYLRRVAHLIRVACEAEELVGVDELEEAARAALRKARGEE